MKSIFVSKMFFTRCMCVREKVYVMVSLMNVAPPSPSVVSHSLLSLFLLFLLSVSLLSLSTLSPSSLSLSFMFQNNYAESPGSPRRFGLGQDVFFG